MCGIAGLISSRPIRDQAGKLGLLSREMAHRGPDDAGFLTWRDDAPLSPGRDAERLPAGRVALVHRRLSIFDLSPLGWQPMVSRDGKTAIVFNGEIYNHRELKAALEAEGERFRSTSDTEVLLTILAREGATGLTRLTGMFAFAHLDIEKRRVLIVRDPLGIKPLHYCAGNGQLAFASEIRPLLAVGDNAPRPDAAALFRYLRHAVTNHGGSTVFEGIHELEPGCLMDVDLDRPDHPSVRRYWRPVRPEQPARMSAHEAAAGLRSLLARNVSLHMRADVPCAAALSGGVDSSGIVALMRREMGDAAPLDVFSYIADHERLSEARWISIAAEATKARVHEVNLDPPRLAAEIDDLIASQEQPFTTTSMWAQAHVYRAANTAGFKIVLDGQGADELFAGYAVFRAARLEGLIRRGRIGEARELLATVPGSKSNALLQAAGGLLPSSARSLARRAVGKPVIPAWLDPRWFGSGAIEHRPGSAEAHSPLAATIFDAVTGSSLPMLLRFADRNAMAASVENRVPYLTADMVEFAFSLPDEILIAQDGTLKNVLRDALRGLVPDPILDRRDKIGFETPEADWFRRFAEVRALASETAAMPLPPCFASSIRDEISALGEGRIAFSPHIWRAMNVIRWGRRFRIDWHEAHAARGKVA